MFFTTWPKVTFVHLKHFTSQIAKCDTLFFSLWRNSWPRPLHYRGFTIILRHTTFCSTPQKSCSIRNRTLYLTTHNTRNRKKDALLPAAFEPAIPASDRPQTQALDRVATGIVTPCNTAYITPFPKNALFPASALKMEAARATETLVPFCQNQTTPHTRKH